MSENIGENVRVPVNILCLKKECKSFRKYSGDCRRVENSRVSKIINSRECTSVRKYIAEIERVLVEIAENAGVCLTI